MITDISRRTVVENEPNKTHKRLYKTTHNNKVSKILMTIYSVGVVCYQILL